MSCSLDGDCSKPLICALGDCRLQCKSTLDCSTGEWCVTDGRARAVCTQRNSVCDRQKDCPAPLACATDYRCRNLCEIDDDCNVFGVKGRLCVQDDNGVHFCAEPVEADNGVLVAVAAPNHPSGSVELPQLGLGAAGAATDSGVVSSSAAGTAASTDELGGAAGTSATATTASGGRSSDSTAGGAAATGGAASTGGKAATGGSAATGGNAALGGAGVAGGGSAVDCTATMPAGGTDHCGANNQGTAGGLAWSLWSNAVNSNSCITTFGTTAFSAGWNNSGNFQARVGLEWGSSGKTYDQYGTISAQFSYTKTGAGGGYSYIGMYGWSDNPCVEYYIVDDRYGTMPFDAYNATLRGTASIDGETYELFSNTTTGSGGSRCSGVTSWNQFWSIRQKARQCGTITLTQHFDAWKAAGMTLGNMLEAKILVEVGGGAGTISFPVANVTVQ